MLTYETIGPIVTYDVVATNVQGHEVERWTFRSAAAAALFQAECEEAEADTVDAVPECVR